MEVRRNTLFAQMELVDLCPVAAGNDSAGRVRVVRYVCNAFVRTCACSRPEDEDFSGRTCSPSRVPCRSVRAVRDRAPVSGEV